MSVATKVALIVLMLAATSSAIVLVAVPALYYPSYFLKAERLSQQPDTYFVLESPDTVVSQAIATPQESVEMRSLEETQIDELIDEHNTHNMQVNGGFYQVWLVLWIASRRLL